MKYAVVAAALAGAAIADPLTTVSVNWDTWTTTTTWDPKATTWSTWSANPTSTSTWTTWDPKQTTWSGYPASTSTWTTWDPKPTTWTTWDPKASTWTTWDPSWSTSTSTWGTWSTWATPVVVTKTQTWANTPVVVTVTNTWSNYGTPVVASSKTTGWATWATPAVVTSVITPGWSSSGWFGPAWGTATGQQCLNNVVTSYGAATWSPVPTTWASWTTPSPVVATATWSTWATPAVVTKTATWSAWAGTSTGNAVIKPNGNKWSMTYSLYDASSNCKTQDVVYADIANIASLGFTAVRVYSTDCNTLEWVGGACRQYGLSIILGVYIDETGIAGTQQQINDIVAWAQWDIVVLIVIGNEAVFQGYCSAEDLVSLVSSSKAAFAAAGYTGPCTLTEPLEQWQTYGADQFCEVVDVVAANLYAFFNADCPAENAGTFIASEIDILTEICVSKASYVMECGWPSAGQCNGQACPGVQEQIVAITAIEEIVGSQIVWFSYENEMWKSSGQFGVEQYWGAASVFSSGWSPAAPVASSTTWSSWATPAPTTTWSTWATPNPTTVWS